MLKQTTVGVLALSLSLLVVSRDARGQVHALNYAQAGALLDCGDAELRILYAALLEKEFDPALAKSFVGELKRNLEEAARRADRAAILLPEKDSALEPELKKVVDAIKRAEQSLAKLGADLDAQTQTEEEGGGGEAPVEEDKTERGDEPPLQRDWDLLKRDAAWLGVDLAAARAEYARVTKKLKMKALAAPPKPKGARD